jgi:peroxiredoxin
MPAPSLELPAASGERRSLREFQGRPVMLSFLGPASCAFCRAHVIRTIQARDEFAALDATVVMVAFHDPELLMSKMMHDLKLPYLLLLDSTRETYARWGLGQFNLRSMLAPGMYWGALKFLLRREPSLGRTPNESQLGGDFVIDRAGQLAYVNRMRSVHDRARIPDLLAALERCATAR